MNRRVIDSLLDLDLYKLTMQQLQLFRYPHARVRFGFRCRTKSVCLPDVIPAGALAEQFSELRRLRFSAEDIEYLRNGIGLTGLFQEPYLNWLYGYQVPKIEVRINDGQFLICAEDEWPRVTLVETLVLSIVNELFNYYQLKSRGRDWSDTRGYGLERLEFKIDQLKRSNLAGSLLPGCIVEFGTRRRINGSWQREVLHSLADAVPNLLAGTSNVKLARELRLKPTGTFAHEMDMVYSRLHGDLDRGIRQSHNRMLGDWWHQYGEPLSIALTDTYGTDFFFRDMSRVQAQSWRGLRHDSGPWPEFGEKVIAEYQKHEIDPQGKTIVWSDGLTPDTVLAIDRKFGRRIKCVYGWGTNLSNDFGSDAERELGIRPLSIVMKATHVNGKPTVKLSDNPAKAVGPPDAVRRFQRIFGYNPEDYEYSECVY